MKGRILKVKQGYNPNSSSMGSIIFALPVSMIAVTFSLTAVSGIILPFFLNSKKQPSPGISSDSKLPEYEKDEQKTSDA